MAQTLELDMPFLHLPPLLPRRAQIVAVTGDPSPGKVTAMGSVGGGHAASASPTDFPDHQGPASGSLALIAAKRIEQIDRWGHTPEADRAMPLAHFISEIDRAAHAVREDLQFNKSTDHMRRHLVALGALVAAAIDRIEGME